MSDVLNIFQSSTPAYVPNMVSPWVKRWLIVVATMIFAMVIVGGATRLTDSGLSITEWQPLLGAIPPLSSADWNLAFDKYKLSSEYKLQNVGMDMASFQFIYWWEWAHRFLGRAIGVVFLVPFLVFAATGQLGYRLWPKLLLLFVVGGLQGALGWYMVSSGLVDRVDVSQYRLAAHLTLAVALFAAVLWVIFGLEEQHRPPRSFDAWLALLLLGLVLLQIAAGGFVAGIDAGMGYNTWPKMDGQWIPSGLDVMKPVWRNAFENAMTVQFNHRILAYSLFLLAVFHALKSSQLSARVLASVVFAQACLGVLTLLLHVPLAVALAHQGGALLVVMASVWNLHRQTVLKLN
jgi:heme a synthase